MKQGTKFHKTFHLPFNMTKFFIFALVSLLVMSTVFAVDIAYIVKTDYAADEGILRMLQEKNMSYSVIADDDINRAKLSNYSVIIIGDDKLRNVKKIPTDAHIVVMNRYHADYFGFIEEGNVLQVSANGNIQMNKKNKKINVYTQPFYSLKKVGLPIYYLPSDFMDNETESITTIEAGSRNKEGSIIAYKENRCFFGIPRTEFWSDNIKKLFEDCMMFVMQSGKHDVKIDESLANSVNGIRIKNELDQYLTENTALECNKKYKIDFRTLNVGSFSEDVNFTGKIDSFTWTAEKEDLSAKDSTTTGSKTISINNAGEYDLTITATIKNDSNPGDNMKSRRVKVVC